MLVMDDLKGNLKWMSTELDRTEVTMYFYGLFHYKVLIYITGLFCALVVQNTHFTSWARFYLSCIFYLFQ